MTKWKRTKIQIMQKTKDWATRTPHSTEVMGEMFSFLCIYVLISMYSVMKVTMAFYKKHLGSLPVTYWGLCCSYFYFEKFAHKHKHHKPSLIWSAIILILPCRTFIIRVTSLLVGSYPDSTHRHEQGSIYNFISGDDRHWFLFHLLYYKWL
jgi:hypothetical protein